MKRTTSRSNRPRSKEVELEDLISDYESEEEMMLEPTSSDERKQEQKEKDKISQCIRNTANFSKIKSFHLMEKGDFDKEMLTLYIKEAAPKIDALFDKIKKLDEKDMQEHGKHFKHMIFTDVKSSSYGAKILASALYAHGFQPAFHVQGPGFSLYNDEKLLETKGNNFGVLMSKNFYDRSMNIKYRKRLLDLFNQRPDNVQGDLMRFIILDQGFKEGIDLYDIKYVHLFEPLVVKADEKQAIGRGTRFCGQKGLIFHPRYGWPLYVFRYEVRIPKEIQPRFYDSEQAFDLYLKFSDLDMRKVIFASELERVSMGAAIDTELTSPIHQFTIEVPPPALHPHKQHRGGATTTRNTRNPVPPTKKLSLDAMRKYIYQNFLQFRYPSVKLENKCITGGGNGNIVEFTPTQDFVRHYFQPSSAYKGALLWHSVGTGKTCTAIATATTSFEKEGYTILWVTRHTLKSDIWKNMYGQVCSLTMQERIREGLRLPDRIGSPKKYLPENWMEPISYKQFSNMLLKKNKIYNEVVKRNGEKDPLHKTLLIIDEAHKLYSPTVASSEKPNTDILEEMIQNSYKVSGDESVRVMLMTATPYTEDGMEMIKLLNLLREKEEQLPVTFEEFGKEYLDDDGYFRKSGETKLQNQLSGYISYLNRSQDARNFSHPVLENVVVDMTYYKEKEAEEKEEKKVDKYQQEMKELKAKIREEKKHYREIVKGEKQGIKAEKKEAVTKCKEKVQQEMEKKLENIKEQKERNVDKCKSLVVKERKPCKEKAMASFKQEQEKIKADKKQRLDDCKDIQVEGKEIGNIKMVEKVLENYQKHLEEIKEVVEDRKAKKKERNETIRELAKEMKEKKEPLKTLKTEIEKEKKKIRRLKDKEQKKKAQKALREGKMSKLKELKKDILEIRNDKVKLQLEKKIVAIKEGKASLGDITQASALEKKCNI